MMECLNEEVLERENEKLQAQINDLNATVLKFTNGQKSSYLLLGQENKFLLNIELGMMNLVKSNTLGKLCVSSSIKKPTLACFVYK